MELSAAETRVLGCMLEKQRTTPDAYPLSLNALRLACNQSSNRDPVVDYDDAVIRDALHRLERRGLVRLASGRGSRAPKYRHLLADALPMGPAEQAIMSVLMLRGPQTPGELKQRAERAHVFVDLDGVQTTLRALIERDLAARLERRPGQKEERYAELLGAPAAAAGEREKPGSAPAGADVDEVRSSRSASSATSVPASAPDAESLTGLHERVARLEREVASLRASLHEGQREQVPS
ncbi:MAG: YceH family protein [Solirubrobacterales bacterium]